MLKEEEKSKVSTWVIGKMILLKIRKENQENKRIQVLERH